MSIFFPDSENRHRSLSVCSDESSFIEFNGGSKSSNLVDSKESDTVQKGPSEPVPDHKGSIGYPNSFVVTAEADESTSSSSEDEDDKEQDAVDFGRRTSFDEDDLAMFQVNIIMLFLSHCR